tara:strand:+ start:4013 stop:4375 length:363 start_codon:yes stop_codon:yes gene_type:complete
MEKLSNQQLAAIRKRLLQLEKNLSQQMEINRDAASIVALDQTSVGRISRMEAIQQQSIALSTRRKTCLRLKRVQAALRALADNGYGFCEQCNELIAFERLLARPEANLCISCQNHADTKT